MGNNLFNISGRVRYGQATAPFRAIRPCETASRAEAPRPAGLPADALDVPGLKATIQAQPPLAGPTPGAVGTTPAVVLPSSTLDPVSIKAPTPSSWAHLPATMLRSCSDYIQCSAAHPDFLIISGPKKPEPPHNLHSLWLTKSQKFASNHLKLKMAGRMRVIGIVGMRIAKSIFLSRPLLRKDRSLNRSFFSFLLERLSH
jgi:hypothetical protein